MKLWPQNGTGKIFTWILIILVLILFSAPRIAKVYIVKHSKELIGRQLKIDKIRLNYFTGTLSITNLVIHEENSSSAFLSFKKFEINIDYIPLFKNEILVQSVSLDNLYLQIMQDGNRFNFSTLGSTIASDTMETDTSSASSMKYTLKNIKISNSYIKYTDVPLDHTIALNKVDLLIPGFAWNSDSTNLAVDFRFVEGGKLYSKLELNQADSTYSVNLKLDSLNLNIIKPYLESSMNISDIKGYFSNDIMIRGSISHIMQLSVEGTNRVSDFSLIDNQNRNILSFKDFTIDIDTFLLENNTIKIRNISLVDPFVFVEMIDTTNNWLALMKTSESTRVDTTEETAGALSDTTEKGSYSLDNLSIIEGTVVYADRTLRFPFTYSLEKIFLECKPENAAGKNIELDLSAMLNGTGRFSTKAVINPDDFTNLKLDLNIKQMSLSDFDAYFKHYFGFPVRSGKLNFTTSNILKPETLNSDNSINIQKFYLDKKLEGPSEYNIPLRLALGVLSDKNGIISMDVPVEMRGEEVKIRNLGKIIFRTIGNLFVKAATSPGNILAGSYNINPEDLKELPLELFGTELDESSKNTLDIIADILSKKPGINIDFYHYVNRKIAGDSLAYILTQKEYKRVTNNNTVTDSLLASFILSEKSIPVSDIKTLCKNFIGEEDINAQLDSIKNWQVGYISRYLSQEKAIDNKRFNIITETPDSLKSTGGGAAFLVSFTESATSKQ